MGEVLLIAAIALIAIGPKQLPEVARVVGRFLNELRRATGDFQKTFLDLKSDTDKSIQSFQQSIDKSRSMPETPPEAVSAEQSALASHEPPVVAHDEADQLSFDINKKGS